MSKTELFPGALVRLPHKPPYFITRYARVIKVGEDFVTIQRVFVSKKDVFSPVDSRRVTLKRGDWYHTGITEDVPLRNLSLLCRPPNWPEEWK